MSRQRAFSPHERLVRGLLHRSGGFAIGSPTGSWRDGPVAIRRPTEPDLDGPPRWWLVVPPGGALPDVQALPAEVRADAALAVVTDGSPPPGAAQALEAAAGVPAVALGAGLVAGGPLAEAAGAREELVRTLAYEDAELIRIDPDAAYARLAEVAEAGLHMAKLRAAMPHTWVTFALVALCCAGYLGQTATGSEQDIGALAAWGANLGALSLSSEPWRLVTAGFLHGGVLHLGINMWVLWDLGQVCERLLGRAAFLGVFLASVVGGCLASAAWSPWGLSVGASGGIFGLAGAILGLLAVQRDALPRAVLTRLGRSVGAFVLFNLLFGGALGAALRIDNAAHVGGLVAGALAGAALAGAGATPLRLATRLLAVALALALLVPATRATPRLDHALDAVALTELLPRVQALLADPAPPAPATLGAARDEVAALDAGGDLAAVAAAIEAALDGLEVGGVDGRAVAREEYERAKGHLVRALERARGR